METVLITGGTGLIGKQLSRYLLKKSYNVTILTRSTPAEKDSDGIHYAAWDVEKEQINIAAITNADYIIHLAGAPVVAKRWTKAYKNEIINSRTKSSGLIIKTLQQNKNKVKGIVSASAIGWYGEDKVEGHYFTEDEPAAVDFLGDTCLLWEQSLMPAEDMGIKVCKLRTGIVLAKDGGALAAFIKPLKVGVAGIIGGGKQVISWIHIDDLCQMYHYAMVHGLTGSYNAVAPNPVTNKALMLAAAEKLNGNFSMPIHVPAFLLKLGLGESSREILKSTTVSAEKIQAAGFTFLYPHLQPALSDLLS